MPPEEEETRIGAAEGCWGTWGPVLPKAPFPGRRRFLDRRKHRPATIAAFEDRGPWPKRPNGASSIGPAPRSPIFLNPGGWPGGSAPASRMGHGGQPHRQEGAETSVVFAGRRGGLRGGPNSGRRRGADWGRAPHAIAKVASECERGRRRIQSGGTPDRTRRGKHDTAAVGPVDVRKSKNSDRS